MSRLLVRDLVTETTIGIVRSPVRSVLTSLGTLLGVSVLVVIVSIGQTADNRVLQEFNSYNVNEVVVQPTGNTGVPLSSEANVNRLPYVKLAGIAWQVSNSSNVALSLNPFAPPSFSNQIPVFAATADGLAVIQPQLLMGRLFDAGDVARGDRVAELGSLAAAEFGITSLYYPRTVFINGTAFEVIGIVEGLASLPSANTGIIIPSSTVAAASTSEVSLTNNGVQFLPNMYVETFPGMAATVASQIAYAIAPARVNSLSVLSPPSPVTLRHSVTNTTAELLTAVGFIILLIGGLVIANTTFLAVLTRTGEIGLRRAMGARRRHIAAHVVAEAAALGLMGGLLGTVLGEIAVVGISLLNGWIPVESPWLPILSSPIGLLIGATAGIYPGWRASRIEPIAALQR